MAYRYLEVGDFVKIKKVGQNHGKFGVVEDVNGCNVIVAVQYSYSSPEIVDRFVFSMKDLLCADRPMILDNCDRYFKKHVDNHDECEYSHWTHKDLVEHIKDLERVIEQHEEPFQK